MMMVLRAGASSIAEAELEPEAYGKPAGLRLSTSLDDEPQALPALLQELNAIEGVHAYLETLVDDAWKHQWRDFHQARRISPRLAIRPPWREYVTEAHELVLVIEPGMAFGTGGHETTRLCLMALDDYLAQHPTTSAMLDVGCGSGVLAIAAAKLGVNDCVGIDNDPDAITVSRENAEANGVEAVFSEQSLDALARCFPLVIANIISSVLRAMRDELIASVCPGGRLVLSGLLCTEKQMMLDTFLESGALTLACAREEEQWLCLEFERIAD
jgi:ribosomal protein L11 methyltransferase